MLKYLYITTLQYLAEKYEHTMDDDVVQQIVSANGELTKENQLLREEIQKLQEILASYNGDDHKCACGRTLRYLFQREFD